jgi:hypothetical protein
VIALPPPAAADPRLDAFFERLRSANPFTDNRVNGPSPDDVDVGDVHRGAFETLTRLAREAHDGRRGLGAVLWGEAGIGKSHLLGRLARWAKGTACFVYLHNLQARPEQLPRSLLRAAVSILTEGRADRLDRTPLFRLVASFAHEAFGYDPAARPSWPQLERAYARLVGAEAARGPAQAALVDRTAYAVLLRFFRSAYEARGGRDDGAAALAVRWLSGDYLDPAEARSLGLPPGPSRHEPVGLADAQQVKQVLVALTRLALAARRPFLLCLDQVDNLDDAQAAALARFLEALIDAAPNLLVVTAGIQASLLHWRTEKVIQDSAWDRLAQFEARLQRVTPAEAERIVAARLARFLEPFRDCDGVRERLREDALFPLGGAWREEFLGGKIELRPRDAINGAREGFRREQETLTRLGGPEWLAGWGTRTPPPPPPPPTDPSAAVDRLIAARLEEGKAQRLASPQSLPPDADRLAGLVESLLDECRRASPSYGVVAVERPTSRKYGNRPPFDLLLRRKVGEAEEQTRLLFVVTGSATSAAGSLRRVVRSSGRDGRLFLVTDARRRLDLGVRGGEYLEKLRRGRAGEFRQVELSLADLAALEALQAVAAQARSGDLELEVGGRSRRLGEDEVLESLHRQGCYRAAPLLRDLLGGNVSERGT